MAVELHILSGTRLSETLHFETRQILIGDRRGDDVVFQPRKDPGARGQAAELKLDSAGWSAANLGEADWLVNQRIVKPGEETRLRPGDVLRLSENGPDLRFMVVRSDHEDANDAPSTEPTEVSASPSVAKKLLIVLGFGLLLSALVAAVVSGMKRLPSPPALPPPPVAPSETKMP